MYTLLMLCVSVGRPGDDRVRDPTEVPPHCDGCQGSPGAGNHPGARSEHQIPRPTHGKQRRCAHSVDDIRDARALALDFLTIHNCGFILSQ